MKFPFPVKRLNDTLTKNWHDRFATTGYDRSVRENVWRRHQDRANRELSGWDGDNSRRRRLLHFRDRYALADGCFCLESSYVFGNHKAPRDEIGAYLGRVEQHLKRWSDKKHRRDSESESRLLSHGDLRCEINVSRHNRHDFTEPDTSYRDLEVLVYSRPKPTGLGSRPWDILKTGIRNKLTRGSPAYLPPERLPDFLPAQVELGCGPSIEAGVLPLNYLHNVYKISTPRGKFVLAAQDDDFYDVLLGDPWQKYEAMSRIHLTCLEASPTGFYHTLKRLADDGLVVGPVLTNNFDGLCLSVGLDELPLRQFDKEGRYPETAFHPAARSLWVVGSHADRRNVQADARRKNLQIVYIDPEGYGGAEYPLESPQDEDVVIKGEAGAVFDRLSQAVKI